MILFLALVIQFITFCGLKFNEHVFGSEQVLEVALVEDFEFQNHIIIIIFNIVGFWHDVESDPRNFVYGLVIFFHYFYQL